jgi:nucleotide-binding universal stress UspA family protein
VCELTSKRQGQDRGQQRRRPSAAAQARSVGRWAGASNPSRTYGFEIGRDGAHLLLRKILNNSVHHLEQPALQAIPDVARETGSAIVVTGAVSRCAMQRTCIGNTAEGVVNDLTCDVLVLKPRGFKSALLRASLGVRLMAMAASIA